MGSTDQSRAGEESVESRFELTYEVLRDRARTAGVLKATLAARFGHLAVAFGLFFLLVVAPQTLLGGALFDFRATFARPGVAPVVLGGLLLVDYLGRLLVRGLRYPLYRQLHEGTSAVDNWRDYLAQSASRLPRTLLVEAGVTIVTVVGLALLVAPGFLVLMALSPITHYLVERGGPVGEGIGEGIALTRRHSGRLGWRLAKKIGWRLVLVALVAAVLTLVVVSSSSYLSIALFAVGFLFVLVRPFVLHFGTMREVAYLSAIGQYEGELELTEG